MRRNTPYVRSGNADSSERARVGSPVHTVRSRMYLASQDGARVSVNLDRWKPTLEDYMNETLSSELAAQDRELAGILDEVDQISKTLKSEDPKIQSLNETLQRAVSCAVKRSLLDRELRSLALTDDLTGLYNRRAFLTLSTQQLKLARRKSQGLLLFFADIDHLKQINDTYGHREGDLALTRAANALERTFRNSDIIARLGGDEFAILALEASGENREVILRRFERNLKGSNDGHSRYDVTLSIGMSRFDPKHPVALEKLIAIADAAMYVEKRNRPKLYMP
jgi:diguanylate cyclase (GGDEF)-like protein